MWSRELTLLKPLLLSPLRLTRPSKGVSASDKATPSSEESDKDKFIGPSGEGSDKAELMFPPNQPLVVVQMLQMLQMLQVVQMIVF